MFAYFGWGADMNIEDLPIEDSALYKLCVEVLKEHDAQLEHEHSETLTNYYSRVRGALAFRVKSVGNRRNVAFTIVLPKDHANDS